MPQVGFEPTIPVFERAKTVHPLDRAATVIGGSLHLVNVNFQFHFISLICMSKIFTKLHDNCIGGVELYIIRVLNGVWKVGQPQEFKQQNNNMSDGKERCFTYFLVCKAL
jgi:hypothetical protein